MEGAVPESVLVGPDRLQRQGWIWVPGTCPIIQRRDNTDDDVTFLGTECAACTKVNVTPSERVISSFRMEGNDRALNLLGI
jgi:hypothetical protein